VRVPEWDARRRNGRWLRAILDILIEGGPGGPVRYADICVGHPTASAHVRVAAGSDGATARRGEEYKFRRYGPFVLPLSCETFGRWGPTALRWWRELSKLVVSADPDLAGRGRWAQAGLLARWWAETSVALQRANADALLATVTRDRRALEQTLTTADGPAAFEFLLPTSSEA